RSPAVLPPLLDLLQPTRNGVDRSLLDSLLSARPGLFSPSVGRGPASPSPWVSWPFWFSFSRLKNAPVYQLRGGPVNRRAGRRSVSNTEHFSGGAKHGRSDHHPSRAPRIRLHPEGPRHRLQRLQHRLLPRPHAPTEGTRPPHLHRRGARGRIRRWE